MKLEIKAVEGGYIVILDDQTRIYTEAEDVYKAARAALKALLVPSIDVHQAN